MNQSNSAWQAESRRGMTIQVPYKWAVGFGLDKPTAYRVARTMKLHAGSFTDAMIYAGIWTAYKVWK